MLRLVGCPWRDTVQLTSETAKAASKPPIWRLARGRRRRGFNLGDILLLREWGTIYDVKVSEKTCTRPSSSSASSKSSSYSISSSTSSWRCPVAGTDHSITTGTPQDCRRIGFSRGTMNVRHALDIHGPGWPRSPEQTDYIALWCLQRFDGLRLATFLWIPMLRSNLPDCQKARLTLDFNGDLPYSNNLLPEGSCRIELRPG